MKILRALLVVVAVACFAVALSYPIRYHLAQKSNDSDMETLSAMRQRARDRQENPNDDAAVPPGGGTAAPTRVRTQGQDGLPGGAEPSGTDADGSKVSVPQGENAVPQEGPSGGSQGEVAVPQGEIAVPQEGPSGGSQGEVAVPQGEIAFPQEGPSGESQGEVSVPQGEIAAPQEGPTGGDQGEVSVPQGPIAFPPEGMTPGKVEILHPHGGDAREPGGATEPPAGPTPEPTPEPTPTPVPGPTPGEIELLDVLYLIERPPLKLAPVKAAIVSTPTPVPTASPVPSPTPDRSIRTDALPYPYKEKVLLDEEKILPELREIYDLNHDLVGWIYIPDTVVDYPVVQTEDSEFYLTHDFYGEENVNGQIILDTRCDPYTPSYNLVISGHHMNNGSMFGGLTQYSSRSYWEKHRFVSFDTLMARKEYVIFAAFYSADYDEDEEGFRYNADIQYRKEAEQWLAEIRENQLYDTEIDADFGDEFITLTTCTRTRRRDGRFVLVCRRIREGETFE